MQDPILHSHVLHSLWPAAACCVTVISITTRVHSLYSAYRVTPVPGPRRCPPPTSGSAAGTRTSWGRGARRAPPPDTRRRCWGRCSTPRPPRSTPGTGWSSGGWSDPRSSRQTCSGAPAWGCTATDAVEVRVTIQSWQLPGDTLSSAKLGAGQQLHTPRSNASPRAWKCSRLHLKFFNRI